MKKYTLIFQPDNVKISVEQDVTLLEAAQRAGIIINSVCGGGGKCNKCQVLIAQQDKPVLACQYHVDQDMVVTIPDSSRFFEQKILEEGLSLKELRTDRAPAKAGENDFGIAIDLGTTTVVAALIDLATCRTAATASRSNPQIAFGDDVISRIEYTRANSNGLITLQKRIVDCINELIVELCNIAEIDKRRICELTIAGNTTMQHLLLGLPVLPIAQAPYVTEFTSSFNKTPESLGIDINPEGNIYVMPIIAAHVGGDALAVTLATAMRHSEEINLALDIGTNGELVLGNKDRLIACSTAAGPAFEGARIKHGMRAAPGAIEHVNIIQDVDVSVIGDVEPVGICGSGLVDAVAELLNAGIIDTTGRILTGYDLPENLPEKIHRRVITIDNAPAFLLVDQEHNNNAQKDNPASIVLTQRDIRETQLAKAAIGAGMIILMRQMNIELSDIDRLYLAGAFGNYIRPESAKRIGIIPNLPMEKILLVGNAAAAGAKEVLLSRKIRAHTEELARQIEYLELAGRPEFQDLFSESLFFAK